MCFALTLSQLKMTLCLCFTLLYAILLQLLQLALKPSLLEKPVNPFLSVISSSRSDFATRPFHFTQSEDHSSRLLINKCYSFKSENTFILIMLLFLRRHLYKSCIIQHIRAHRSFPRTLGLVRNTKVFLLRSQKIFTK